MKKLIVFLVFFGCIAQSFGQKYFTKTGTLNFEGSVEAFEPVKASNKTTTAILDVSTGKLAVLGLVKGFRFKNALMEEHFNENYMESDTYPKATFTGMIDGFSIEDISTKKEYTVEGDLTIHGKTKKVTATVFIVENKGTIDVATNFSVAPGDFDIEIPSVVSEKISDTINISASFNLVKR
ncbi:YceI family protein [uncultured Dokdonia sp.]|uniref:YceI family protein n=1 Tax=uncultured Dokdonia sp. TaxID=575653 RepID=UPI00262D7CBE|nr:YceI family protein [uncultured Dokdonia sp.]